MENPTWADLKAALGKLTEEQLSKEIVLWGADSADSLEFDILEEDYLYDGDEGCAPKSVLEDSQNEPLDLEEHHVVYTKGSIILLTDKLLSSVD